MLLISGCSQSGKTTYYSEPTEGQNIREENGVQIIHVLARGGYTANRISAQAGKTTKLEIETKGTYDCSSSFTIPSLGYRTQLPATGKTLVDIPSQEKGTKLTAACSMGMYSFDVMFN